MQKQGTMRLWLTLGEDASEWVILGNSQDCREGLTYVTCQFHNLPDDLPTRLEYLQGFDGVDNLCCRCLFSVQSWHPEGVG